MSLLSVSMHRVHTFIWNRNFDFDFSIRRNPFRRVRNSQIAKEIFFFFFFSHETKENKCYNWVFTMQIGVGNFFLIQKNQHELKGKMGDLVIVNILVDKRCKRTIQTTLSRIERTSSTLKARTTQILFG